jgi:hypothetical protein
VSEGDHSGVAALHRLLCTSSDIPLSSRADKWQHFSAYHTDRSTDATISKTARYKSSIIAAILEAWCIMDATHTSWQQVWSSSIMSATSRISALIRRTGVQVDMSWVNDMAGVASLSSLARGDSAVQQVCAAVGESLRNATIDYDDFKDAGSLVSGLKSALQLCYSYYQVDWVAPEARDMLLPSQVLAAGQPAHSGAIDIPDTSVEALSLPGSGGGRRDYSRWAEFLQHSFLSGIRPGEDPDIDDEYDEWVESADTSVGHTDTI